MIKRKFCIIQIGSRYDYKIPLFFAQNNILSKFYTDIHASHLIFKWLDKIPKFILFKPILRLLGRKLPLGLPKEFVSDSYLNIFFRNNRFVVKNIFSRIIKDNFASANSIYTNLINDDIDLLRKAKKKGIYIFFEVIINPNIHEVLSEELRKFPKLGRTTKKSLRIENKEDKDMIKLNLADKVLVPSYYIYKEILKKGISKNKIKLVEHSLNNNDWLDISTKPIKGRILFVGEVSILKGIHYFAEASRILNKKNLNYEFLVVGRKTLNINNKLLKGPKYLGHLSRDEIKKIYASADVFVMTSLSDAFPTSHLEAMACGLPVIITNTCGSIIEDGLDGFVVPSRDSEIVANKIEEIVSNRNLRNKLGKKARIKIKNYKVENYFDNLKKAIELT